MRAWAAVALFVALGGIVPPSAGSSTSYFAPKNRVLSRASLAGVTPRSSWDAIRRAWGGTPSSGTTGDRAWGRTHGTWGSPGMYAPIVARVLWAGLVGARPIQFMINLDVAEGMGYVLRTTRGERVGTTAAAFRRQWPGARRLRSDAEHTYYLVDSSYRGWQLAFLFRNGRLKRAELVRNDFVNACYRKVCARGFPPR